MPLQYLFNPSLFISIIMSVDQKVQKLVKKSLGHLCQEHREEALDLLIVLGLKHYQLLYTNQAVHLPILEYLCGELVRFM